MTLLTFVDSIQADNGLFVFCLENRHIIHRCYCFLLEASKSQKQNKQQLAPAMKVVVFWIGPRSGLHLEIRGSNGCC